MEMDLVKNSFKKSPFFAFFSGKISLSLLNRRNSLHYRYWLEKYLL